MALQLIKNRLKHAVAAVTPTNGHDRPARCLVYHDVVEREVRDRAQMTVSADLLRRQLGYALSLGYAIVDTREHAEALRRGARPRPATLSVTFDDGLLGLLRCGLPVLADLRARATVFLVVNAVDRQGPVASGWQGEYLGWSEVRELQRSGLISFGCHGQTHRPLRGLASADLWLETAHARERLEDVLGEPVSEFSYPFGSFGSWDQKASTQVREAGFDSAYTSVFGAVAASRDAFSIRRCRVAWPEHVRAFARLLSGAYDWYAAVQRVQGWLGGAEGMR